MDSITHREMRNNSAEVLRRVEAGESLQVSNHGRPAALIVPVGNDPLDASIAAGTARAARTSVASIATIRRTTATMSSAAIIEDVRGRW
ncbi:type II toxin-antitoxin system Phd/YefM family antitoxin [Gordonia sp. (in: high G+C Gram-positive bacteria)]|uniref:type II toxin-antitoxin system Phd/YefM family antitoxin n=1 Tax=Gordonia sp. (in: high G+C Gram-positive bacteria) TaxID=84139 RepID=UPI001DE0ACD1|nr:type II toxin-antitoxin system prevent-host-death family antitoxin [Gordonia sp. (in: high G+C Gram-positive bacteria)]MCB1296925.1 type II toxin-antitoxin system prevent-host-death family antitoxin [Gordonia sp. (in: high G+C Gram-positive bacteria)]HMS77083.1 type II toxin-antitoxin system prevent-host-death family antitoxin [Gordonia sp. (in: high G+C Gram-positive bacteria)]HQV16802.1 type II toxin-antitoxin system prevent-host-death family antitoxin [Gordonia sp. (in: high G+C Gram-posit